MERYFEIFERIPDGVTLHDPDDGSIIDSNQQFRDMLGYSREELLELDFADLHPDEPPYTSDRAMQLLQQATSSEPQTFEWVTETKQGSPVPVEMRLRQTAIEEEDLVLAVVREISERKQRERELRQERDRANALFEKLGEPAVEVAFRGADVVIENCNAAFLETFNVTATNAIGAPLSDLIDPDAEQPTVSSTIEQVRPGEVVETTLRQTVGDELRTFLLRTAPYSLDGEPRAYAIYFDITARERQEERFEAFIQHSTDIISVLDANGVYEYQSPSSERILGYTPRELRGEVAFEYVHPADRERVMEKFGAAVADAAVTPSAEYRFKHNDGSWVWLESIGKNQLENPAIEGFVVNSREVSDRKEYEQRLERQNERLDEFASIVSHDLRNPLNVASGNLALARSECESAHLGKVANALDRMEQLIQDVLTLSRAGDTIGDREPVNLAALTRRCMETVFTDTGSVDIDTDAVVLADESRLQQLLENLLRNAIEHGGDGIHIRIGDLADGFYVEDDGPGIPAELRAQVFEGGYSTTGEGTGFGLTIVEQIVSAHGWEIQATESDTGGARFEITAVDTP